MCGALLHHILVGGRHIRAISVGSSSSSSPKNSWLVLNLVRFGFGFERYTGSQNEQVILRQPKGPLALPLIPPAQHPLIRPGNVLACPVRYLVPATVIPRSYQYVPLQLASLQQ